MACPLRILLLCAIPPILRDERVGPFFVFDFSSPLAEARASRIHHSTSTMAHCKAFRKGVGSTGNSGSWAVQLLA
jgi:hypothetical protein